MLIGYHPSHEQFTPSDLLQWAVLAKHAGFGALNSADHFHPWSENFIRDFGRQVLPHLHA